MASVAGLALANGRSRFCVRGFELKHHERKQGRCCKTKDPDNCEFQPLEMLSHERFLPFVAMHCMTDFILQKSNAPFQ